MEITVVWIVCGVVSAVVASNKGRGGCGWSLLAGLLGPLGLILALVMPPVAIDIEREAIESGACKKCPYCAELIRAEAVKCRYCGSEV